MVTVRVYIVSPPRTTGSTLSVLCTKTSRSAAITPASALPELLVVSVSVLSVVTFTTLWMVVFSAATSGRRRKVAVYWVPGGTEAQVHSTVPLVAPSAGAVQLPPLVAVAVPSMAVLAGSASVILTLVAVDGPLLRAVTT